MVRISFFIKDNIKNKITNFVILNGLLDILNILLHIIFGISWYNFVLSDITKDFLYFVTLYGIIRLYEGVLGKSLYLSITTYLMEVIYFYEIDTKTSMVCLIISLLLIFSIK